jgi:hypothetical protein
MLNDKIVNDYQKMINTAVLDQLTYAFYQVSIVDIKRLLHDQGVFCGVSKNKFLSKLNQQFNSILESNFGVQLSKGIALNGIPGAEVLEFRFLRGLADDEFYDAAPKSFGSKREKNEIIIRLSVELGGGKIQRIEYPTHFISGSMLYIPSTFYSIN